MPKSVHLCVYCRMVDQIRYLYLNYAESQNKAIYDNKAIWSNGKK